MLAKAFDGSTTPTIVSDLKVLVGRSDVVTLDQQVSDLLVVDLCVAHTDRNGLIKLVASKRVHLCDGSRQDAAVLELGLATGHSVGFAGASLTVAENCPVVALNDTLDHLSCTLLVEFVLARIMQNFFKLELPLVRLVVDKSSRFIFIVLHNNRALGLIYLNVLGRKVCSWPSSNNDLNRLFG